MEFWDHCELIERIPGKMGGQPVIKGTRIRAQTIIDNFEAGSPVEEIAENWPELPKSTITGVLNYYHSHQPQAR
jgi:uncharacterized protein (DUF433 family)